MKYAKQPHKPDWYQSDDSKIYGCAVFGTSPFNEWYEFKDHEDALDLIKVFNSVSCIDEFNGEYYRTEESRTKAGGRSTGRPPVSHQGKSRRESQATRKGQNRTNDKTSKKMKTALLIFNVLLAGVLMTIAPSWAVGFALLAGFGIGVFS